jgi:hypothetical protein
MFIYRGIVRRIGVRSLAVTALMIWFGSGAAMGHGSASESKICSAYRCATLVAGAKVRVFKATERHEHQEPSSITFAQWLPTGQLDFLTKAEGLERGVSHFVIAGRYLAFADEYAGEDEENGFSETTVLLNVETGREREMPGWFFTSPSRGVVQVALTSAGSLAWMIEGLFGNPTAGMATNPLPGRAVYALRAGGKGPTLLAYSEDIVPMSLAAISGHIYWLETSGPRTYAAP